MGMAGIPALMGIDISGSLKIGIPLAGAGIPQDRIWGVGKEKPQRHERG
jgi:hypothetical protein